MASIQKIVQASLTSPESDSTSAIAEKRESDEIRSIMSIDPNSECVALRTE